jgi:hypothetical protein
MRGFFSLGASNAKSQDLTLIPGMSALMSSSTASPMLS